MLEWCSADEGKGFPLKKGGIGFSLRGMSFVKRCPHTAREAPPSASGIYPPWQGEFSQEK